MVPGHYNFDIIKAIRIRAYTLSRKNNVKVALFFKLYGVIVFLGDGIITGWKIKPAGLNTYGSELSLRMN